LGIYLTGEIAGGTHSDTLRIINRPQNAGLLGLLLPDVVESVLLAGMDVTLDRYYTVDKGSEETKHARATISSPKSLGVVSASYYGTVVPTTGIMYLNNRPIGKDDDLFLPSDESCTFEGVEAKYEGLTMRHLLTAFAGSSLSRVVIPRLSMPVPPVFFFESGRTSNPILHVVKAGVSIDYWSRFSTYQMES
jgi:hypothetical protein